MSETTRPTPQQIEGRLASALSTIATLWPTMIQPPSSGTRPRTTGTGALLDDADTRDDDMRRLERLIEARREVMLCLRSWCQVTVEDHDVQHGIPVGTDVPAMCGFLTRWSYLLAEHEAALDLLAEVEAARGAVERWAPPASHPPAGWAPPRRTMRLGSCPLIHQDPVTSDDAPCAGQLRGDEDGWVTCDGCGTEAVMGWWERQLYGEDGLRGMTIREVVTYLHSQHGRRCTVRGLRAWVTRGDLVPSGTDDQGRHLYDAGAVEAALTRRRQRA